jgi:phage terminase large subunit-like protein
MNWVNIGRRYARDVIEGHVPACEWVKLACRRSERDFERFAAPGALYRFDQGKANAVCGFISSLRHVQDSIATKAGDLFQPLPWQVWQLTNLFGYVWTDNGKQRFGRAYTEQGRGGGKTTLAAGIVLYRTFAAGVHGAQATCAASLRDQARLVLDTSRKMVLQDDTLRESLGLEVTANAILQPRTNSKLWALSAKALSAEGLSIDVGVLDEVHAQRGRALHDTLASGAAKKENSLFYMVTTAGDDSSGVAFEIHSFLEKLLTGEAEDDSYFCMMSTIDPGDDWQTPEAWRKANPSLGICIDERTLAEECKRAQQIPGARANFRTKHLCEWIQNGGDAPFLDDRAVKKCYDPDLDEKPFEGQAAASAADLASRLDLCSAYRIHSRRIDKKIHHYAFGRNWLPEAQRTANVSYPAWEQRGELVLTVGTTTDQDVIEAYLINQMEKYQLRDISFDPIQSSMLMNHLEKKGGKMIEVPQSAKYLTPGLLELQEAVVAGRFHTNSQILIWCLGNLRVRTVGTNMLQPVRPADRSLKIDAAVAVIMALRSVAGTPLDEWKTGPRIFSIDWSTGTIENVSERVEKQMDEESEALNG